MTTSENGKPQFTNRISDYLDDGIEDYVPESKPDVILSRSDYDELLSLAKDVRRLYAENAQLREDVRRLDLDQRAREIDVQSARFKLARQFAKKLKKLRERVSR